MSDMVGRDPSKSGYEKSQPVHVTNNAAHFAEQGIIGGGANEADQTNNLTKTQKPSNLQTPETGTGAQNVGAGGTLPIYLTSLNFVDTTAGTVTLTGLTDLAGAASTIVIPATTGPYSMIPPGESAIFASGCTIQLSTAADFDKILIGWRPIN